MRMKPSSGLKKISHAKARNVAMLNLLATPGLGSLAAGRWLAGAGQLFVFMAGFVFFCGWMFNNLHQYYGLMYSDAPPPPNLGWNQMAWASVVLCGGAWLWSLVTSLSLMREAAAVPVADLKLFGAGLVKLEEEQISSSLAALPLWQRQEQVVTRTYEFKDFPEAMKFVNAVAALAEQAQHHPDLDVRWNKVTLAFTTHDAGGLTNKDFALARECDELAQAKPPELRPAS